MDGHDVSHSLGCYSCNRKRAEAFSVLSDLCIRGRHNAFQEMQYAWLYSQTLRVSAAVCQVRFRWRALAAGVHRTFRWIGAAAAQSSPSPVCCNPLRILVRTVPCFRSSILCKVGRKAFWCSQNASNNNPMQMGCLNLEVSEFHHSPSDYEKNAPFGELHVCFSSSDVFVVAESCMWSSGTWKQVMERSTCSRKATCYSRTTRRTIQLTSNQSTYRG